MPRLICAILLAAAALSASPVYDITYNRGPHDDGTYVYGLSYLTLQQGNGNPVTLDAMCFDFLEHIYDGQKYQGEAVKLTDYSNDPVLQTRYDIAGFAYIGMHDVANITNFGPNLTQTEVLEAIQFGIWDLIDTNEGDDGVIYHGFKYTNLVDGMVDGFIKHPNTLALLDQTLQNKTPGALDNLYVIQGVGRDGDIQKFIVGGNLPNGVPEPGSMCLMGGGLLVLGAVIRRRVTR